MQIETSLAKGSMDRVEMRDPAKRYHMMSVADLQKLSPNYDWTVYLDGIGMSQVKDIDVASPGYVTTANEVLGTQPLQAIKAYLRWHALHERRSLALQAV